MRLVSPARWASSNSGTTISVSPRASQYWRPGLATFSSADGAMAAMLRSPSAAPPLVPQHHNLNARDQLPGRERLHDVVFGAAVEAHGDVGVLALRGQHDDDRRLLTQCLPDLTHHGVAVLPGHHHVAHEQVGPLAHRRREALLTIARGKDFVACARELDRDQPAYVLLVLDHQNTLAHAL